MIAHSSITSQYAAYYEEKLADKTAAIARNTAKLFIDKPELADLGLMNGKLIESALNLVFAGGGGGPETILYALFATDGAVMATSLPSPPQLPEQAWESGFRLIENSCIYAFAPVTIDGLTRCIVMVSADFSSFLDYVSQMESGMYSSLLRGCVMMSLGYFFFCALSNISKTRKTAKNAVLNTELPKQVESGQPFKISTDFKRLLRIQLIAITVCAFVATPLLLLYTSFGGMHWLLAGLLPLAVAAAHLCRLAFWALMLYLSRPISSYSAQTLQFCIFLIVFISLFSISIQNGYQTQLELSRQDELRMSSVFAAMSLGGADLEDMLSIGEALDFGQNSESIVIVKDGGEYQVLGHEYESMEGGNDLLDQAWNDVSSVTGVRGDYIHGLTAVVDHTFTPVAIADIRQPYSAYVDELRGSSVDFLLGMSATVLAFVFLFIEINKLLEVINLPNRRREQGLRYAQSSRSLVFICSLVQNIPIFFFVLMVYDIYANNPVSWLPADMATMLPLALMLPVMVFGGKVAKALVKANPRFMTMIGCGLGVLGYLSMNYAENLFVFLFIILITYTGISIIYHSLGDFISYAASFDYPELSNLKEDSGGGEFLGATVGAVIGAMVYDKFGLFSVLLFTCATLLILTVLIWFLLPAVTGHTKAMEKPDRGAFKRFVNSNNVLMYTVLLILPFAVAPYFIYQFSPLYAGAVALSPGAASWTTLLCTISVAYIAPPFVRMLAVRLNKVTIALSANILVCGALLLFSVIPGIVTLFVTSWVIGIAVGVGLNANKDGFAGLEDAVGYEGRGSFYDMLKSMFGPIGALVFTAIFALAHSGEYISYIAAFTAAAALTYFVYARKHRKAM